MLDISEKLFTTFNDVVYYDVPHKYYLGDKELISATTLIHRYQEPFDEEYWSTRKALEFGLTRQEVKNCWKFINVKGTMKGSIIHDYTENLFLNKVFYYPKDLIIKEFGFDPILNEYLITKNHVDEFKKDCYDKLIPIRTELIVYDKDSLVGGMMDMIFYNVKAGEYQVWDWKTNKDFTYENRFQKLGNELECLDDCDFNVYSLQLSLYKYIIEKHTGIKFGKSYVTWFSHNNPKYIIIEMTDRTKEIEVMLNKRKNTLQINN